ncbi:response regulator [Desmonostoc muscorum LEGE 12446]|uniref:histidine kinase n=1 Tax=Desmonostoc muscorum LEGE 12446 TaxID=1828758 RepID=A0A8J6ZHK8_DESMC|nr:response regulator [Desmonostoc muscorum]MCF2151409.1 response regulator [Desmonostoc muscorum LEGE 12446]
MNSSDSHKGDILIVDDTIDNLRLLSKMLTEQGYEVRCVTNGATALMGIKAQPPDLILLDITMPGLNGYEVCQQLKVDDKTSEIPVIFISALNETFDKVKAFSVGGVDYISKPFQLQEVFVRIETQLKTRRLQAQLQVQNSRLQQAETDLLKALEQEKELNLRLQEMATIEERNRIARDIHDSLGHSLVALNIQLEAAMALWQDNTTKAYECLLEAKQLGSETLKAVRDSVALIRSEPLQSQLLEAAIANLTEEFYRLTGILPETKIQIPPNLRHAMNTTIYRILQEGLTNICKYAQATAVQIQIEPTADGVELILEDNGKGFQVNSNKKGFGLQGMQERIAALGGQLEIASQPNRGCRITARFPQT